MERIARRERAKHAKRLAQNIIKKEIMSKNILFLFSALMWSGLVLAQSECGTTAADNGLIKAQMLENRARISATDVAQVQSRRAITYVPITVHLVGTSTGQDFPNPQGALFVLCALNRDFAVQDIQFYFNPNQPIRYLANQTVYNDGYSQQSIGIMGSNKAASSMNIYIGNTVSSPVAGYYSRQGDFVFIRKGEANMVSKTLTHEAGHFFTLPHTFYGWENLNYDDTYNAAPSPVLVNGNNEVEYKTRTGANANCDTEADGFCDTEADYYSFRVSCNHNTVVLDPDGERLTPSNRNYMSYFDDSCMDTFTQEQRDAILRSLMQRNWMNFATPNLNIVTSNDVTALLPLDSAVVQYNSAGLVNLQWQAASDAVGYIVSLDRILFGQPVGNVFTKVVYSAATSTSMSNLPTTSGEYRWTVVPFGRFSACDALPKSFAFTLLNTPLSLSENITTTAQQIFVSPNPIPRGSTAQINVHSPQACTAQIRLYSIDGRLVWQQNQALEAGDNNPLVFSTEMLTAGMYVFSLQTPLGTSQQKLIVR
jgi:hypothetical protein